MAGGGFMNLPGVVTASFSQLNQSFRTRKDLVPPVISVSNGSCEERTSVQDFVQLGLSQTLAAIHEKDRFADKAALDNL